VGTHNLCCYNVRSATPIPVEKSHQTITYSSARPREAALEAFRKMEKYEAGRKIIFDALNQKVILGVITKTDPGHILAKATQKTDG
jgi:predicted transcriptional regulator